MDKRLKMSKGGVVTPQGFPQPISLSMIFDVTKSDFASNPLKAWTLIALVGRTRVGAEVKSQQAVCRNST